MVKYIFALLLISAAVTALPQRQTQSRDADAGATILRSENDVADESGSYSFAFETSNGIKREEQGRLEQGSGGGGNRASTYTGGGKANNDESGAGMAVQGSYSYINPEGKTVTVTYTAGEKGFRPKVTVA